MQHRSLSIGLLLVLAGCGGAPVREIPGDKDAHRLEIERWRRERDEQLRAADGWLTLVGLFWLGEGENRFGTGSENDVVFPPGVAPERVGTIFVGEGQVEMEIEAGVPVTREGEIVQATPMKTDADGEPTVLALGSLSFFVIDRDGELALRLKDHDSPMRRKFTGIDSYPIDIAWRIEARFEPYDPLTIIRVPSILGTVSDTLSPGAVVFEVGGQERRLDAMDGGNGRLFIVFGDETNGRETYGGGRFLDTEPPREDGRVVIDFNRAYNPPCVFTPYATCPLPPRQNELTVRVEAGEKIYGGHH